MYRETHTWVRTLRSSGAGAISSARFYKHSISRGLELCANKSNSKEKHESTACRSSSSVLFRDLKPQRGERRQRDHR